MARLPDRLFVLEKSKLKNKREFFRHADIAIKVRPAMSPKALYEDYLRAHPDIAPLRDPVFLVGFAMTRARAMRLIKLRRRVRKAKRVIAVLKKNL